MKWWLMSNELLGFIIWVLISHENAVWNTRKMIQLKWLKELLNILWNQIQETLRKHECLEDTNKWVWSWETTGCPSSLERTFPDSIPLFVNIVYRIIIVVTLFTSSDWRFNTISNNNKDNCMSFCSDGTEGQSVGKHFNSKSKTWSKKRRERRVKLCWRDLFVWQINTFHNLLSFSKETEIHFKWQVKRTAFQRLFGRIFDSENVLVKSITCIYYCHWNCNTFPWLMVLGRYLYYTE